jgi:hypothetical protein
MMRQALRSTSSLVKARQTLSSSSVKAFSSTPNEITLDLGAVFSSHCKLHIHITFIQFILSISFEK